MEGENKGAEDQTDGPSELLDTNKGGTAWDAKRNKIVKRKQATKSISVRYDGI